MPGVRGNDAARSESVAGSWLVGRKVSTVDFGTADPVRRSAVELRFLHLSTVLGLIP
jgi:hypothetical protein